MVRAAPDSQKMADADLQETDAPLDGSRLDGGDDPTDCIPRHPSEGNLQNVNPFNRRLSTDS